jgi:hypothetical protein
VGDLAALTAAGGGGGEREVAADVGGGLRVVPEEVAVPGRDCGCCCGWGGHTDKGEAARGPVAAVEVTPPERAVAGGGGGGPGR